MGFIYKITNKINNQCYIGQTTNSLEERWRKHKQTNSNCRYLKNAFHKYGIDNFEFQLICICFDTDLNKFEIEYIKKHNSLVPNGYNLREGGENGGKHSIETKTKISETLKNTLSSNKTNNILGRIHNEESKKKMSNAAKGRKLSSETKEKLKLLNSKHKVIQLDIFGNIVNIFLNTVDAAKALNTTKNNICMACNGKRKSAKGFIFRYEN